MARDGERVPAWRSERPAIRWGAYAWAVVGFLLAFALLWRGLGYVRIVVAPLTLALLPAAVLIPVAAWLEEHEFPPALAALTVLFGFLVALFGILFLMGAQVTNELSGLVDQLQSSYEQLKQRASSLPFLPEPDALFSGVASGGGSSGGSGGAGGGAGEVAASVAATVATIATQFFLFLVAVFFYIKDREAIADWLEDLFPRSHRDDVEVVGARMWDTVSSYIRGQTIVAAFDGVFVAIGLLLLGIPLAIVLGGLVFFGAFVPVVGSIVAGAVAVVVALVSKGLVAALLTLAIIVAVQQIEGNILAPYVLGRQLSLHPLMVLVAITVGAVLLGVWGALIAVPAAASIHRAASYIAGHHRAPEGA